MKQLIKLFQGIKHSNPLKESYEAKLLCSNALFTKTDLMPLLPDDYEKNFKLDLMVNKKVITCANR